MDELNWLLLGIAAVFAVAAAFFAWRANVHKRWYLHARRHSESMLQHCRELKQKQRPKR